MVEPPCLSPDRVASAAPRRTPEVDAVVLVKPVVFGRDQRVQNIG